MKEFVRETEVKREGDTTCEHAFLKTSFRKGFKFFPFPFRHIQERICFHCGRHEIVTTFIRFNNPFTFESVVERFNSKDAAKVDEKS